MGEDDTTSAPTEPITSTFRRLQQRRGVIARLDNTATAYWQTLVGDSLPYRPEHHFKYICGLRNVNW
jgi:hypothetical protein